MTRARRASLCVLAVTLASAVRLEAQTIPSGAIEASVGLVVFGETSFGSANAALTTPSGPPSTLFTTSTALERASGPTVRIGVRVWRRVEAEMFASFTKPKIVTTVSGDVEGAAGVAAKEQVKQYVIGGGGLWYLPGRLSTPRFLPFVSVSAAYLRELHEGDVLAETGHEYGVGGGAKYFLRSRPSGGINGLGVRADAGVRARSGAAAFDDDLRYSGTFTVSLFVRF